VEKPDRPAVTSRPHGNDRIRMALTHLRILGRWIEVERALWDAAMTGDVRAVNSIVQIVQARVRLNGLEAARDGFGGTSGPRTLVVPPTV
jgi:hypothetical protein